MKRLIEKIVLSGLVTACRRARRPTRRSPPEVSATTEGVVRSPSALGITIGSPPSMVATTELVVPRSIPIIRAIRLFPPKSVVVARQPATVIHCHDAGGSVSNRVYPVGTGRGCLFPRESGFIRLACL